MWALRPGRPEASGWRRGALQGCGGGEWGARYGAKVAYRGAPCKVGRVRRAEGASAGRGRREGLDPEGCLRAPCVI